MDLRLVAMAAPVLIALTWAVFNIFKPAKDQFDGMRK
jgi:hypothetical protein